MMLPAVSPVTLLGNCVYKLMNRALHYYALYLQYE